MLPHITQSVSQGGSHCVSPPNPPCALLLRLTPGLCKPRVSLSQGVLIRFCQSEALKRSHVARRGKGLAPFHLHGFCQLCTSKDLSPSLGMGGHYPAFLCTCGVSLTAPLGDVPVCTLPLDPPYLCTPSPRGPLNFRGTPAEADSQLL